LTLEGNRYFNFIRTRQVQDTDLGENKKLISSFKLDEGEEFGDTAMYDDLDPMRNENIEDKI
jgi:hypothetical protein